MNQESRTQNSKKNIINGLTNQVLMLIIAFLSRTLFIKFLGAEYLGINGLYSNILQLLSLTELGLGNIALFTLYKPLAEHDEKKISGLIRFYSKLYHYIFIIILVIGFCLIPFLNTIVNSTLPYKDLVGYYILFLLNTSFSYLYVYKQILINADQRIYIIKNSTTLVTIVQSVLQIIILYIFKNYYLYLIIQCICTLLLNVVISYKANRYYPFLKNKYDIPPKEKKEIFKQTKDLFVYRLGGVLVNSTDNIIISILLGTIMVGYYSNYYMIIGVIINFINVIIGSIVASIGNLNVNATDDKKLEVFNSLLFTLQWIISLCSICMIILFNDFIYLWLGANYLLSQEVVIIIVLNFYIQFIISPIWIYRETMGLYSEVKYLMIVTAVFNIILSFLLGKWLGMIGVFIATILSRLLTIVWYEPIIIFKKCFHRSPKEYYINQLKYFAIFSLVLSITQFLVKRIVVIGYVSWVLKAVLIVVIVNVIYLVIFNKNKYLKNLFDKFLKRG